MLVRKPLVALLAVCSLAAARAENIDIDARARSVAKSLVHVQFTLQNENQSQEGNGQGLVISKDGIVLISGELISESNPKEWIKEIKLRLPSKNFTNPVTAKLLGRTKDGLFAFLKPDQSIDTPPFEPGDIPAAKLGQQVFSVGVTNKDAGYETYVGVARVKTTLRLRHWAVRTTSFGLTGPNSPVFDAATGKFLGLTLGSTWEGFLMTDGTSLRRVHMRDDDQGSAFYPASEVENLFKNIPTEPFKRHRPWLGADEITGLQENLVALKKLDQSTGVMLGSIIAGEAGDKAGLKAQDLVLTVDGKPFSTSPVPEIMTTHFARALDKKNPGDTVTLGILRDGEKQDIKVTLGTQPKMASEMPYIFSSKVGIVTRDLVWSDAYSRRLPQDTKGVMVALVKTGAPAAVGATPLRAQYLITKVDDEPVENQEQFLTLMKKLEENPAAKEVVFVIIQQNGQSEVCRIDLTK